MINFALWIPLLLFSSVSFANLESSVDRRFQLAIDRAFQEIMQTKVGRSICDRVFAARATPLALHLGLSKAASEAIVQDCHADPATDWVYETPAQVVDQLSRSVLHPRHYLLMRAPLDFPIESWTDPFTNTTVLVLRSGKLTHSRLVQLLAHEMAVYLDSKSNPAHPAADHLPPLRRLVVEGGFPLDPMVAISNPLVAHTLTYVRALQVEFAIIDELVAAKVILPPPDFNDPFLRDIISQNCQDECLQRLVAKMKLNYLPMTIPLLALAPHYRALLERAVERKPLLAQWLGADELKATFSAVVQFLSKEYSGRPVKDLAKIFALKAPRPLAEMAAQNFMQFKMSPLEALSLATARVSRQQSLLEFMKAPLLSGYNINLSSGPRVRIKTGNAE